MALPNMLATGAGRMVFLNDEMSPLFIRGHQAGRSSTLYPSEKALDLALGKLANSNVTKLGRIGLAFEGIVTEPLGSTDLKFVHSYCIKKTSYKVSYLGFAGNNTDARFSWEIDAVRFRGRGILHFTGRRTYDMLGLSNLSNSQLDFYFSSISNNIEALLKYAANAGRGLSLLHSYTGSSAYVKGTDGYKARRFLFDSPLTTLTAYKNFADKFRAGLLTNNLKMLNYQ